MLEAGFIVAIVLVGVYAVIRVYEQWKNQDDEELERYVNQSEDVNLKTETEGVNITETINIILGMMLQKGNIRELNGMLLFNT